MYKRLRLDTCVEMPKIDPLHYGVNGSKLHRKPQALIDVICVQSVARRGPNQRKMTRVPELAVQPTQSHLPPYELVHEWLGMTALSFHKAMLIDI